MRYYYILAPIMATEAFKEVKGNFERVEEFGWFLPDHCKVVYYDPHYTHQWKLGYRLAAVLFLIAFHKGELHVLMTKRSQKVSSHKGEDCLPGGIRESADLTPADTALREAQEEVQLDPKHVEVISVLPPFVSGWSVLTAVTPVVCILRCDPLELELVPNTDEVVQVYWMPLRAFFEAKTIKIGWAKWTETFFSLYYGFNYFEPESSTKHFIWGLTVCICATVSCIALNRPPIYANKRGVTDAISSIADGGHQTVLHRMATTSDDVRKWEAHRGQVKCAMFLNQWPKATDSSKL